jgi:hypothetical protein
MPDHDAVSNTPVVLTVAIVGSRKYPNLPLVRDFVRMLPPQVDIISGGAKGVDQTAEFAAREYGKGVTVFAAEWDRYGKAAGFIRNQDIVDCADVVVAFWDGKSRGTQHSIALAQKAGTPHYVFPAEATDMREALRICMEEANRREWSRA